MENPQNNIYEFMRHNPERYLSPAEALLKIERGEITYLEIEKMDQLDMRLITFLHKLADKNLPVYINVHDPNSLNDFRESQRVDHFISHIECISGIIRTNSSGEEDFTLKNNPFSLYSNTYFVNEGIDKVTVERIRREKKSPYLNRYEQDSISNDKFIPEIDLPDLVQQYQTSGKKVVVIGGVFDVVHEGHINFIEQAKKVGDIIIILVNSDYSVSLQNKNKNGDRPIHPLVERLQVLASLNIVDHVSAFNTDNILSILEQLPAIVYVKTEKDVDSVSVKEEMSKVVEKGGETKVLPAIRHDLAPEWMSSTGIIDRNRTKPIQLNKLSKEFLGFPELVRKKSSDMLKAIIKWDKESSKLLGWKKMLESRFELSVEEMTKIECQILGEFMEVLTHIRANFDGDRSYLNYIIPFIFGKLLGLEVKIMPVQYNKPDLPLQTINMVKLSNGSLRCFDLHTGSYFDQIKFEDIYWRPLPNQCNFIIKPDVQDKPFAKRLYAYDKFQHNIAISVKILMEEYYHADEQNKQICKEEIIKQMRKVWVSFTNKPFKNQEDPFVDKNEVENESREGKLPDIVAHGGISIHETVGGFPENSRASFLAALERNINTIEIDVVPTKDGKWVVSHDIKLDLTTNATGLTIEKTWEDLKNVYIRTVDGDLTGESLLSLEEALDLIGKYHKKDNYQTTIKIDVKYSIGVGEKELVDIIRNSQTPINNILMTSGSGDVVERIHKLEPTLPFELNTVETVNYLMAYGLMDTDLMPDIFLEYINHYAPQINAKVVSLMQFAMNKWGEESFRKIVYELNKKGLQSQVWVVKSMQDYMLCARVGATQTMMDDLELINEVIVLKLNSSNSNTS